MGWSWRIARIAGIGVHVHVTFLALLVWVAVSHYLPRRSWAEAAAGLGFVLALFAIVVLHEFGHALAARRYGIRTRDITLLPIGGVARLERMPEDPRQELVVALAGPAVNVVLAVGLFGLLGIAADLAALLDFRMVGGPLVAKLIWVNVALAVFNLIPAFPMDGGRVLRALLALRMEYVRATQIAAGVGQALAVLFGFVGLFVNPFLVFIALFVWMGAESEASLVQMRAALAGIPVRRTMVTDFRTLSPRDSLDVASRHVLSGFQQDFPVLEQGHLVGVLTRDGLVRALAEHGGGGSVAAAMDTEYETALASEMLEPALERLRRCRCRALPVLDASELVGMLTLDRVGEFLSVEAGSGRRGSAVR